MESELTQNLVPLFLALPWKPEAHKSGFRSVGIALVGDFGIITIFLNHLTSHGLISLEVIALLLPWK